MKKLFSLLRPLVLFIFLFSFQKVVAQEKEDEVNYETRQDSLLHFNLLEVKIIPPYKFKNHRQENKYQKLEERVKRVYPVSLIVLEEYDKVNKEYAKVYNSKRKRKKYIKWYQDHIYDTYIDTLKALSYSENKLLLKLISYQTGKSPYVLIKEFRGTGNAWLWRGMALMVGANLNTTFDEEDDKMLLHIIRRMEADQL
ncbi:DUF4294 domain-containing protein [Halosquirtibacter xylanolyticus]|uniref:DUF4294 domain-containing protein n=1 Tax=Halosquirtibacter xylanolyticus TaxID=3374599 RepID=UPI00374979C2|nr:DUF4294 domain-containing protein [Prolixibacteraceae bacterium]